MTRSQTTASHDRSHADSRDELSVKLIGVGGVGGMLAPHLARFLAALDQPTRLVLIDGDHFESHNSSRMEFETLDNKAEVVRERLRSRHENSDLAVLAVPEYVAAENVDRLIEEGDHILLAVDNHATRLLVSDHCTARRDVALISGGNDGVGPDVLGKHRNGTFGTCQVYVRREGEDITPSLTRYHPEIARPADTAPTAGTDCLTASTSQPQLLFTNLQVACCMGSALFQLTCGELPWAEVAFDVREGRMRPVLPMGAPPRG